MANNGSLLPDSAGRGTNPTDWACTKDNKTSLVWELKTDDNGLRDKDSYYALDSGKGIDGDCKGSKCDVPSYTNAVNAQNLCGIKKWRMPVIEELEGLVFLNTTYFPDTDNRYYFLSSTPNGSGLSYVNFDTGESLQAVRDARLSVRLVGNASDLPIIDKPAPITPPVTTPVIPSISGIGVSPTPVTLGDSVTFNATLNATLPTGYFVKLKTTSGFILMSGNGSNYSISQTPTSTGVQTFSIGIYDASNVLKGKDYTDSFEVIQAQATNSAPTLTFVSGSTTTTTGVPYSVQLSANDKDNNLAYIYIDWGDGTEGLLEDVTENNKTLTFSHAYATANTYAVNYAAYDSNYLISSVISKSLTVSKPAVVIQPVTPVPTPVVTTNSVPTVRFSGGASTATVNSPYSVELTGNDKDNNLVSMYVDWGDNSQGDGL